MSRFNRKCLYCGEEYYVCRSCISEKSYKNSCDTVDCYKKLIVEAPNLVKQYINIEERETMAVILRAGLIGGHTIDIVGYDLELGKFDCSDGYTRTFQDFEYFILPKKEFQTIGQRMQTLNEARPKVRVEKEQPVVAQVEPIVEEAEKPKQQAQKRKAKTVKQASSD